MVVINLQQPPTNLQAILGAGSNIARRVAENIQKIKRDEALQKAIQQEIAAGRKVGKTFGKGGQLTGFTAEVPAPAEGGFVDIAGQTGTKAVTVPSAQPTINAAQVLGGAPTPVPTQQPTISLGQKPTMTTPAVPSAPTPSQPSELAPFGGQTIAEELTAKKGPQTLKFKRQPTTKEIQADILKGATKAAAGESAKAAEKAGRGILRASIASDTAFDEVVRFNREQFEKFGVRPGDFLGLIDKLTPKQLNTHKAAAVGAGREAAATVGMQIIPAARAVRMVDIFAKSSAELGNTIEGNANNVAASMKNAFGNALAANVLIPMADGTSKPMQDVTIDKQTGLPLSQLPFEDKLRALNDITGDFRNKVASHYILGIYERNPELLQPDFRQRLDGSIEMEDAQGNKALVDPNTQEIILEL